MYFFFNLIDLLVIEKSGDSHSLFLATRKNVLPVTNDIEFISTQNQIFYVKSVLLFLKYNYVHLATMCSRATVRIISNRSFSVMFFFIISFVVSG